MKNIRQIIVPIDFSEYSKDLLIYASSIAERTKSNITVLSVINSFKIEAIRSAISDKKFGQSIIDKYINDVRKKRTIDIENLIDTFVSKEVTTRTIIQIGVPFEEILKIVDDEEADLVVINSKERCNFEDYMYGTTSEKVFRHCPVPLLSLNLRN